MVTVYAQHLSYDLSNIAALTWSSESISPSLAMQRVFQNTATAHSFTCQTDYSEAKPFSVAKPQSVRACLGGVAGSFLDLWGGEYEWDNFHVIHHQGRGQHTGVVIEYGKNLTELEHDSDTTEVYTDLLPYAVISAEDGSETVVTLTEVLLPITDTTLSQRKTLIRDFTDSFGKEETVTEDALRTKAQTYLSNNPLGVEVPALTVSFEPLWKQPEYAAVLERVSLCDSVTIRHSALGITAKAKVITTVYDTLAEKYVSITLGSGKANLLNNVSDAQASAEEAAEKAGHFPALMNSAIQNATDRITGQTGGYVVLHTDSETGLPYELLILDQPSIEDAVNVWRWNVEGLGFSSSGYNGPYETAITADGQIIADFITSGSLIANIIKAGVIQSQDGSSWWDLESGEVMFSAYATTDSLEEVSGRVSQFQQSIDGLNSYVADLTESVEGVTGELTEEQENLRLIEGQMSQLQLLDHHRHHGQRPGAHPGLLPADSHPWNRHGEERRFHRVLLGGVQRRDEIQHYGRGPLPGDHRNLRNTGHHLDGDGLAGIHRVRYPERHRGAVLETQGKLRVPAAHQRHRDRDAARVQRQHFAHHSGWNAEEQPALCPVPLQAHQRVLVQQLHQHPRLGDRHQFQLLLFQSGAVQP